VIQLGVLYAQPGSEQRSANVAFDDVRLEAENR
jgi:hypothetical protein